MRLLLTLIITFVSTALAQTPDENWAESVKLPPTESAVKLFNGKDLSGWEGQIAKYWSVNDGAIRGTNTTPVAASTYLFTNQSYREFRLLLEVKQTRGEKFSTMHSAVCALGEKFEDKGDPFSFRGPLLMFCNDWGIWDANRRNRVFPAGHGGQWQQAREKVGEWNRLEILVIGDRIRMAVNGVQFMDFTDKPEVLKPSPIGLQIHSNNQPQEYHFRGLILTQKPDDRMMTVDPGAR